MINIALAIAVGLIAVIGIVVTLTRETSIRESKASIQKKIDDYLYKLDASREKRYNGNEQYDTLRSLNGFRNEWNSYYNEYEYNFGLD